MFGIAGVNHIAHIQIHSHTVRSDLIQKTSYLQRGEQKTVPHVFDADGDPGLLGVPAEAGEGILAALIGYVIADLFRFGGKGAPYISGDNQNGIRTQKVGCFDLLLNDGEGFVPDGLLI